MTTKRKRKGGRRGGPKFTMLSDWMMNTPAWRSLSPVDRALYIEVKRRYDGKNNGTIGFAIRDAAAALNVSKSTAARAFALLEGRGFLVMTKKGAFSVKCRVATEWLLTEERDDRTGALPSKAFRLWEDTAIAACSENTASAVFNGGAKKKHGPTTGTHIDLP